MALTVLSIWSKLLKKLRFSSVRNSQIHSTSVVESGSNIINSTFGRFSYCGYDCEIVNTRIGSFTSISNDVHIGGGAHPHEWVAMSPVFYDNLDSIKKKFARHRRPDPRITKIGNDVWIGQSALIRQGVAIGDGAVVGMGSVVTKDVDPYAIVAGNPARLLRMRFDSKTIRELRLTEWWNWPEAELERCAYFFNDVGAFLHEYKNRSD